MRAGSRRPSPRPSKAKVPVYVLGSQAIFGRAEGYMNYTDPKTKQVFYGLPVRQGPESVMLEQIRLPFWYDGPQYDILESGFGPYALSRLAGATGGIYFITRFDTRRMGFDPARMREYKPDWDRREQYEKQIAHSPFRQAVLNAALITQQKLPGMPGLYFPPADVPEFKEAMANNQGIAERTAYTVDEAIGADQRRRQAPRPRDLPALAGALRPDPGPAPGHEGPLLRVQLGLRPDEEGPPQVQQPQVQRLEARPRRGDPV